MEAINPNDIAKLDTEDISCITLKNGKMITVDKSAPEKFYNKTVKIKNDFNLISNISKNINFSYRPSLNKNISNYNSDYHLNKGFNNNNLNKEEISEEEKMNIPSKRKSRNYFEKMDDPQKPNFIISLNIPADLNKRFNTTQKTFYSMVTQLKQKRNKYSTNLKDRSIYQRYYELYKNKENNNKFYKTLNLKKIQHYQIPEGEDKKNDILNKYHVKNINLDFTINTNLFSSIDLNDSNTNIRTTANSFYGNKTRSSSVNQFLNYKVGSGRIEYSSTLICPSNIFKSKLE